MSFYVYLEGKELNPEYVGEYSTLPQAKLNAERILLVTVSSIDHMNDDVWAVVTDDSSTPLHKFVYETNSVRQVPQGSSLWRTLKC